jgi:hypothetical protein
MGALKQMGTWTQQQQSRRDNAQWDGVCRHKTWQQAVVLVDARCNIAPEEH